MGWRTLRGHSGAEYDFERVFLNEILPRTGGLFLVCAEDDGGVLQDLAVGLAVDFGLHLNPDNLASSLEQCGVKRQATQVRLGVLPAGPMERDRIAADLARAFG